MDGREIPAYVCGHCSDMVVLNPTRERPRRKCQRCGSLICEQSPICLSECIPVHELANDNFRGPLGPRAQAVMMGARTSNEVDLLIQKESLHGGL